MCCRTTVAIFLHPCIFNQIYSRIIVVAAFLLFGESGTEALILLAHKKRLRSAVKREAWVDASKYPKTFSSINFWTCLASPLTTLIWWVIHYSLSNWASWNWAFDMQGSGSVSRGSALTCLANSRSSQPHVQGRRCPCRRYHTSDGGDCFESNLLRL